jgi:hypothetical protein
MLKDMVFYDETIFLYLIFVHGRYRRSSFYCVPILFSDIKASPYFLKYYTDNGIADQYYWFSITAIYWVARSPYQ